MPGEFQREGGDHADARIYKKRSFRYKPPEKNWIKSKAFLDDGPASWLGKGYWLGKKTPSQPPPPPPPLLGLAGPRPNFLNQKLKLTKRHQQKKAQTIGAYGAIDHHLFLFVTISPGPPCFYQ